MSLHARGEHDINTPRHDSENALETEQDNNDLVRSILQVFSQLLLLLSDYSDFMDTWEKGKTWDSLAVNTLYCLGPEFL